MSTIRTTLGDRAALSESVVVAVYMLAVTLCYEAAMLTWIDEFEVNYFELLGTWCALNAVWLVRTENIQNWIWGITSAILLGVFFGQIGLPGQQWLQWAFFLPIQVWCWYYWATAGAAVASTNLPVTFLRTGERIVWMVVLVVGTWLVLNFVEVFAPGSAYPELDALVVVSSMMAQFLLGRKKVESWILWLGPVNVVSIVLFAMTGAYVLTALYVAFLVHAVFGVRTWMSAAKQRRK